MEITEEYLLFQDLWRSNDYKDLKKLGPILIIKNEVPAFISKIIV